MLIPRSQGRVTSRPTMQQHTPMTGLSSIGNAIGGAFEARDQEQREAEVSAKRLELYNNEIAKQEAKVKLDDILTTEMNEQATLVKNSVSNGAYDAKTGQEALDKWSEERFKQIENELPEFARQDFKNYWQDNLNRQSAGLLPLQLRADAQKGVVLADRYGEIASRYERKQGREYLESNLTALNLSEADKQARLYNYESARDLQDIDERIATAVSNRDTEALSGLITEMDNGGFGYTDAKVLQQRKSMALGRIDALNKQSEAENEKRKNQAGKIFNDFKTNVLTGRMQDDDYRESVRNAVAGTEYEGEFQFYEQQSNNFQAFSKMKTSDMLARINEQKAKMKNTATADATTEGKILGVYESIYQDKLNTIKQNPNQAVRETGLEVHTLSGAELKSNPQSFAAKAAENAAGQLALNDPNIRLQPISAEDLPEAKKAWEGMGVNEKLNAISQMISSSKGMKNGNAIWGATLGQLGGGDLSYVMAGVARMNGYKSTQGEDVATAIVSGTQALKNKQMILPKDELLIGEFSKYVGNSVSGSTANMSFAAFKSIYAHLTERNNYQHKDKDDISKDLAKAALSMATGGVYDQGVKFGNQKSWKVSKPYGMDDTVFENRLSGGYGFISQTTGIPVAELESLRLRRSDRRSPAGEIQYDLIDERGRPLVVDGAIWRIKLEGVTK